MSKSHGHRRNKVEAEVEKSGNSFNILRADQAAAAAAGYIAVAVALTGGINIGNNGNTPPPPQNPA